VELKLIEAIC
jgi:hypothetical protein